MKYVAQFMKKGRIVHISHLDLQRLFLRVFRMSGILPAYSGGFNPHPKLSLVLPLSTGFASDCEYLEVETTEPIGELDAATERVRSNLPAGVTLLRMDERERRFPEFAGYKSLASRVRSAEYAVYSPSFPDLRESVSAYLRRTEILVEKADGKPPADIRPRIRSFECTRVFNRSALSRCTLAAGGGANLNPLVLMSSFYDFCGHSLDVSDVEVARKNIFFE
ncbi:MAG: TIGR03936 family radical SAM-associated protein [Clostridiales Family XIII bacterium]|jgi:radical SAM-linked protein|nr:TIGR03936 family radical SAM-associated protein [Clostridiales Family XIII bacterium]